MKRIAAVGAVSAALVIGAPATATAQEPQRTEIALVIRISAPPLFDIRARPAASAKGRLTSLQRSLGALLKGPASEVPFALAPSPVLCDELAVLGTSEAKAVRSTIRKLARRSLVVTSPYAEVRLPEVSADDMTSQIAQGRRALTSCTDRRLSATLLPPDFALDREATETASKRGIKRALSNDVSVRSIRNVVLIPARVSTQAQPADVVTSVVRLETPTVVLDGGRPDLAKLVASLGQYPSLALRRLDQLPNIVLSGPSPPLLDPPIEPPRSYRLAIAGAENAVARLRSFTLPGNKLAAILKTSLARARGSAEWNDRWSVGRDRARAISRIVRDQRELLSVSQGSVTFTSRRGSIPVTVASRSSFPFRVRITVSSPKLDFPTGASRVVVVTPPGDTVQFQALARSTGTFPMRVELQSPDRRIDFASAQIDVRSTAANVPALVLTAGGAIFLVIWYGRRRVRRRAAGEPR